MRLLAGLTWIAFCWVLIGAGIRTILQARRTGSWDPAVVRMSIGSGIFAILAGLGLLWFGFTQLSMFGIFMW